MSSNTRAAALVLVLSVQLQLNAAHTVLGSNRWEHNHEHPPTQKTTTTTTTTAAPTTAAGGNGAGGARSNPCAIGAVNKAFGLGKVTLADYDPSVYNMRGRVEKAGELDCSFDMACCWGASRLPSALEFRVASGSPDKKLAEKSLKTPGAVPSSGFLVVETPCASGGGAAQAGAEVPADETDSENGGHGGNGGAEEPVALFVSCTVPCSDGPITVEFKYWSTSPSVQLQACVRDAYYEPQMRCQDVDLGGAPGPASVTLPRGTLFDVLIVAKNFAPTGDLIVIDDIKVAYSMDQCRVLPTPPAEVDSEYVGVDDSYGGDLYGGDGEVDADLNAEAECLMLQCDFEMGDTCAWMSAAGTARAVLQEGHAVTEFAIYVVHELRLGNYVTGIRQPDYAMQGQSTTLTVMLDTPLSPDRAIVFQHYEATTGIVQRLCCDGDCDGFWQSDEIAQKESMQWLTGFGVCPEGTMEVSFQCEATESANQGACGIDEIRLVDGTIFTTLEEMTTAPSLCDF